MTPKNGQFFLLASSQQHGQVKNIVYLVDSDKLFTAICISVLCTV